MSLVRAAPGGAAQGSAPCFFPLRSAAHSFFIHIALIVLSSYISKGSNLAHVRLALPCMQKSIFAGAGAAGESVLPCVSESAKLDSSCSFGVCLPGMRQDVSDSGCRGQLVSWKRPVSRPFALLLSAV